jgi:hypothetical protein
MTILSDARCAICGQGHSGGCRMYPSFVSEREMFGRLLAIATESETAWARLKQEARKRRNHYAAIGERSFGRP